MCVLASNNRNDISFTVFMEKIYFVDFSKILMKGYLFFTVINGEFCLV